MLACFELSIDNYVTLLASLFGALGTFFGVLLTIKYYKSRDRKEEEKNKRLQQELDYQKKQAEEEKINYYRPQIEIKDFTKKRIFKK